MSEMDDRTFLPSSPFEPGSIAEARELTEPAFVQSRDGSLTPANAAARALTAESPCFQAIAKVLAMSSDVGRIESVERNEASGEVWFVTTSELPGSDRLVIGRNVGVLARHRTTRGLVHELRNISFGLLMTIENLGEEPLSPDGRETLQHLRGLVARVTDMAAGLHELSEPLAPIAESVSIDTVLDAVEERFPRASIARSGTRGTFVRGDAAAMVRAVAHLVAVVLPVMRELIVAVSVRRQMVELTLCSNRSISVGRSLGVQVARRLILAQGGELSVRQGETFAFVVAFPETPSPEAPQEGAP